METPIGALQSLLIQGLAGFLRLSLLAGYMHQNLAMLHKCANPACSNPFRKLSEGKLFLVETDAFSPSNPAQRRWDHGLQHRVEHFWLCAECASVLTLSFEKGKGLQTIPLPESVRRKAPIAVAHAVVAAESA